MPDDELLATWRGGDAKAGKEIQTRYGGPIRRFFANKVTEDIEDRVQETFLACLQGTNPVENLRGYLFGIAYNVVRRHFIHKNRLREEELDSRSVEDLAPGPSTMQRELEQKRKLLEALRKLPLPEVTVLELKYWEDMSSAEIAEALGMPASTVRSHLKRGRDKLARLLEHEPPDIHED
ncbi:RNA polymerase sigma factor [Paraliomyxa miuraensis]|uniref:RNA polymerase sigma factor n=1 Tax=Paraliomyxa miuraensis TaxID=376150 RepID=UPI002252E4F3|nr:sigma-70 family RNA polymerase sigma factor [Paraliomyxa miuraensis]MCX4239423.1 sigma-70 family RNA polymerase sigma factor [Paraliomyxa miuraensis]